MKRTACGLLLLSILIVPSLAFADTNFNVRNLTSKRMCIYCGGPWFRLGESHVIYPNPSGSRPPELFYTAETNIFSPFGPWGCGVKATTEFIDCDWRGTLPTQKTGFCVYDLPGVQVNLTINADESVSSDKPPPPCNDSAVFSFLGDSPAGQRYEGAYRFAGSANETVTVTLDRDGARGSEGEIAQLTLRREGGESLESRVGAVPITFTAKLPKTGNYEVTVDYPPDSTGTSFRGYYQLDVTATSGEPVMLGPINP